MSNRRHDRRRWLSSALLVLGLGHALPAQTVRGTADEADTFVNDCGINSLYLMLRLCSLSVDLAELRRSLPNPRDAGLSMEELQGAANSFGLRLRGAQLRLSEAPLDRPVIAFLQSEHGGHYVVLVPVGETGTMVQVLDFPRPPRAVDYARLRNSPEWTGKVLMPVGLAERIAPFAFGSGVVLLVFWIVRFASGRTESRITQPLDW